MLSQNKIKLIRSLQLKKNRQLHNCFLVEGEKMVVELLESNFKIQELFALQSFISMHSKLIKKGVFVSEIKDLELKKISSLATPNQAIAIAEMSENKLDETTFDQLSIALDNIQDPGNLGTIIRTANWFGVHTIFCSTDTVDVYNSKVIQSTMGAIFRTQIVYGDLTDIITKAKHKGQPVYGAILDGENLYSVSLNGNGLIVLGNESKGISKAIQEQIDHKIRIPNYPLGSTSMESLNVGVANAILLAEFRRIGS